jgi:hypothetical protein
VYNAGVAGSRRAGPIPVCAELLRRLILNEMEYEVIDDSKTDCWLLVEKLTGSTYRVVTKNRKITNCFWNYYRADDGV